MNTINKLLKALNENIELKENNLYKDKIIYSGQRKWLAGILPYELLELNIKKSIEILLSLDYSNVKYNIFPDNISTPNYSNNWGRFANYIEINNRAISQMHEDKCKNGILSSIKILPAIPPSAKSWANCIILSQIFPNIYGDGYNKPPYKENSIYGIKLNAGYSKNIIDFDTIDKISALEQFEAFNTLAHFHGLKTGFRTVISADQIKIADPNGHDIGFNWKNPQHQELFIKEHVNLINCGFEAIFIDSAKHIGGYDMINYAGVGDLPEYEQMQYILHEIRVRTKSFSLSFIGEKTTEDFQRYEKLGLTTGTSFVEPDDFNNVRLKSEQLKYHKNYAPGVEVSNDNDNGGRSYEQRLHRINNVLFAYEYPSDKLASFMQMEDIFPLRYDTSTHHLMMSNPNYSTDGTEISHWKNLFAHEDGRNYNRRVGELFSHAMEL